MLRIEVKREEELFNLILQGEVDASNSVNLDSAMAEIIRQGAKRILVDGRELEYISSAGLGVFMSYLDEFQESETKMVIFGLNEKVYQVFVILGLDKLITIKAEKEEALDILK